MKLTGWQTICWQSLRLWRTEADLQIEYSRLKTTKYIYIRVPQCTSPRRNWDSPHPFSRQRLCPSPRTKGGGGHTRRRARGWGSPNSDDWRKSLALSLLFAQDNCSKSQPTHAFITIHSTGILRAKYSYSANAHLTVKMYPRDGWMHSHVDIVHIL
jgi:hypothetical protein